MEYKVRILHMEHEEGTKDYHIAFVTNSATNITVMLRRWGRVGSTGQTKEMKFNNPRPASVYAQKIIDDKTSPSGGYRITSDTTTDVLPADVATSVSSQMHGNIFSQDMFKHLDLTFNEDGLFYEDKSDNGYAEAAMVETITPALPDNYGTW